MLQFVLYLTADDGAAVLEIKPFQLFANLGIEVFHKFQIRGIVTSHLQRFGEEPVGQSSITYLTMTERTYTHDDRHVVLRAEFNEVSQVALTIPAELAFHLFVKRPEHIRRHHRHSTGLHLHNLLLPLCLRVTHVMELAHHRYHGTAVYRKIEVVNVNSSVIRNTTHTQVVAPNLFRLRGSRQFIHILRLGCRRKKQG